DRTLLALKYVAGFDATEIGRAMGMSASGCVRASLVSSRACDRRSVMTDQFEARLTRVLRSDAEDAVRPIDAGELAVAAIASSAGARRSSPWPRERTVGPGRWSPQLAATGALLALAGVAGVALARGARRVPHPPE